MMTNDNGRKKSLNKEFSKVFHNATCVFYQVVIPEFDFCF